MILVPQIHYPIHYQMLMLLQKPKKLGINKDSKIVVYDSLGIYTSPRAWWLFTIMGHDNVWVLDGGLPGQKKIRLKNPKKNVSSWEFRI
jgi:thiosulfate/3-mercaptopyruvate sulfurtransferase